MSNDQRCTQEDTITIVRRSKQTCPDCSCGHPDCNTDTKQQQLEISLSAVRAVVEDSFSEAGWNRQASIETLQNVFGIDENLATELTEFVIENTLVSVRFSWVG